MRVNLQLCDGKGGGSRGQKQLLPSPMSTQIGLSEHLDMWVREKKAARRRSSLWVDDSAIFEMEILGEGTGFSLWKKD